MTSSSIDTREIRRFGVIALIFFGCLSALGFWTGKPLPAYLFGSLSLLGLGFIVIPSYLKPLHAGWLKVAHFIGRVVTTGILTIAYYVVITPSGLVKRLISGRPLPVKPDIQASSYWVVRGEPVQPRERYLKRY